jgi:GTP-binding protein HflX
VRRFRLPESEILSPGERGQRGVTATDGQPVRAAVILPWTEGRERRSAEARLEEAMSLAASIGLVVVHHAIFPLREPRPGTLLGTGQVALVAEALRSQKVSVVIVDAELSPVQQRNLERAWGTKVIDRTGLILETSNKQQKSQKSRINK